MESYRGSKEMINDLDKLMENIKIKYKKVYKPRQVKKIIPKGLSEFFYGTYSLYALNQKNADRKALKKGYLAQF